MSALRVVCSRDTRITAGLHKHKCDCGTIWFHDMRERDMQSNLSREEFREAHTCPNCGLENREKFFANEAERIACHEAICEMLEDEGFLIAALLSQFLSGDSIEFSES